LEREDVADLAIPPLGGHLQSLDAVDELDGDTDPTADALHAALDHVTGAKLATDLARIDGLALVRERRAPRDHGKQTKRREPRDQLLGDAIGEKRLRRIGAAMLERQHGDRRPAAEAWDRRACRRRRLAERQRARVPHRHRNT
jgi:hypothetical protein